jgi:adenine nucleotide transporter 17
MTEPLLQFLAGALAGSSATASTLPLDCIRVIKTHGELVTAEAVKNRTLKALGPASFESAMYIGVQFGVYEILKGLRVLLLGQKVTGHVLIPPLTALLMGSAAAAATQLITCPLKVIVVRIQSGHGSTFAGTVQDIYRESGLKGFWRGLYAALMVVADPAITLFAYERLQFALMRLMHAQEVSELHSVHLLLMGMLAKCVAILTTYPIRYAKVKLQAVKGTDTKCNGSTSIYQVFVQALQRGEVWSLYDGLSEDLAQCCIKYGLVFMLKSRAAEMLRRLLFPKASTAPIAMLPR